MRDTMNATTTTTSSTATTRATSTTSSTTSSDFTAPPIPISIQHYHGITLQAIGLTLVGGLCVSTISILAFGLALLQRQTNIAPRCTMRHPNTIWRSRRDIYNPKKKRMKKKTTMTTTTEVGYDNGNQVDSSNSSSSSSSSRNTNNNINRARMTEKAATILSGGAMMSVSQWKENFLHRWWEKKTCKQIISAQQPPTQRGAVQPSLTTTTASSKNATVDFWGTTTTAAVNNKSISRQSQQQQQQQQQHLHNRRKKQDQHVFKSNSTKKIPYNESITTSNGFQQPQPSASVQDPIMMMEFDAYATKGGDSGGGKNNDPFRTTTTTTATQAVTSDGSSSNNAPPIIASSSSAGTATTTTITSPPPSLHPQDRGNPFLGWIPWTLHLSYDRMLRGIPGTGTRSKGMEGKLLGVNLDAIVLFRYHALCLRVTVIASLLCIGIILPMNITACEEENCPSDLTNYGRTTIANVVSSFARTSDSSSSSSSSSSYSTTNNSTNTTSTSWNEDESTMTTKGSTSFWSIFWTNQSTLHLLRLYAIAICTWYITFYTLKNIKREWRENLVLRRVYYLEADHYGNRMAELERTVYNQQGNGGAEGGELWDDDDDSSDEDEEDTNNNIMATTPSSTYPHRLMNKEKEKNREPWIPHPEHRDTVPSIELYSVLVGGLPSLPDEVVNSKDMQTAMGFSKRASIDWQLAVATTFFDHCVPNQPGFSSSVVAVTILPGAPELAKAWRKWYSAAAALRRLRFIRQVIREKRYYDIEDVDEEADAISSSSKFNPTNSSMSQPNNNAPSRTKVTFLQDSLPPSPPQHLDGEYDHHHHQQQQQQKQQHKTALQLGKQSENSSDVGYLIFQSLNYGPEQQAVYSREMAQGAAACCPNGCCEGRVRRLPIDRLLEMEDATILRLEKAQYELQCAQMKAAVSIVDVGDKAVRQPLKEDSSGVTDFVLQQRTASKDGYFPGEFSSENFGDIDELKTQATMRINQGSSTVSPFEISGSIPSKVASDNLDEEAQIFRKQPSLSQSQCVGWDENLVDVNIAPRLSKSFQPPMINTNKSFIHATKSPILPTSSRSSSFLRMNSEGRFLFDSATTNEEEEVSSRLSKSYSSSPATLRRRANTAQSAYSEGDISRASNQWNQVNSILRTTDADDESSGRNKRDIETGVWVKPSLKSFSAAVKSDILSTLRALVRWTKGKTDPLTSTLAKDSTYAVVTFSSRQASVAARHCLADGRGVQRWLSVETVPVPPLADSAPCDIITCRGCCRPVTLNINNNQLMLRRYIALASLVFIYVFYTIPITAAQSLVAPQSLQKTLPGLQEWLSQSKYLSAEIMSGLVSALLYTSFFAICPVMFKAIANSGSQATSVQEAEKFALQYYWYFMLVTAFVFTGLADAAINILNHKFDNLEQSIEVLMENIAAQTPLTTAATWLNWIIVRTTMTLPLQYLLQINSFIFSCLGMKCCARCVMGGGPGGPIPYRIYVDGGVVFLCVVALAPQSPLVAPVALLYYLVCVPLWRRNCIFVYRPKFDSGGERWPFLSDMLITSLFMGQFLLTLQMLLRDAFGPAIVAAMPSIPTYLYRNYLIKRFRRAYDDAGLLQTSLLDGWDNTIPSSIEKREEFRQFLVDAHKAAYIPVCIAGGATNILTAEPAVVIPSENDDMLGYYNDGVLLSSKSGERLEQYCSPTAASAYNSYNNNTNDNNNNIHWNGSESPTTTALSSSSNYNQPGAFMRRAMSFSAQTPRSSGVSSS